MWAASTSFAQRVYNGALPVSLRIPEQTIELLLPIVPTMLVISMSGGVRTRIVLDTQFSSLPRRA